MKKYFLNIIISSLFLTFCCSYLLSAQTGDDHVETLPVQYEELTAPDFIKAVENQST